MDVLTRIKRLALRRRLRFSIKAADEMEVDGLTEEDIVESLVNARRIEKTLRSRSRFERQAGDKLYVIKSSNFSGTLIYTKGGFGRKRDEEVLYILVSAKLSSPGR